MTVFKNFLNFFEKFQVFWGRTSPAQYLYNREKDKTNLYKLLEGTMDTHDGILMCAEELEAYLGITRNATYTLLHSKSFPTVKIGTRLYAVRTEVDHWIQQQTEEGGYTYDKKEGER